MFLWYNKNHMELREAIQKILEIAVCAPSGDNSQPWEFRVYGNEIHVFNIPGKDTSLYNFENRGSYLAHGALVENISIASQTFGFSAKIIPFPSALLPEQTAIVVLSEASAHQDQLFPYIKKRVTNRKPYKKVPLEARYENELIETARHFSKDSLCLVQDRERIEALARIVSLNERLILENKPIHDFLFSMIRWTPADEVANPGLYIKTFELPAPAKLFFKIMKSWSRSQVLAKLGFPSFLAAQTTKLYSACSALGVVLIDEENKESFFTAGRIFQRLWLVATKNGLSIQPITALPYLDQRISHGQGQELSPVHRGLIRVANEKIRNLFQISNKTVAMLFRIGYGEDPSAQSLKMPPRISFLK